MDVDVVYVCVQSGGACEDGDGVCVVGGEGAGVVGGAGSGCC